MGNPDGERQFRYGRRWVEYMKMNLKANGWDGVEWPELAQDRASGVCCKYGNEY